MGKIERFEDIECWKKARELTSLVYAASSDNKLARDYGLRDQLRRASVSILSNIAEGFERDGDKEFLQFLSLAKGSCGEVRAQLYVALDQHYITNEEFKLLRERAVEISRMLSGMMNYLRQSEMRGRKYREP
jgi:four helix bundle protein